MKSSEPPITTEQADNLLTYLIIGVIFGGRLGYVLFYNFGYYTSHPLIFFVYGMVACHLQAFWSYCGCILLCFSEQVGSLVIG